MVSSCASHVHPVRFIGRMTKVQELDTEFDSEHLHRTKQVVAGEILRKAFWVWFVTLALKQKKLSDRLLLIKNASPPPSKNRIYSYYYPLKINGWNGKISFEMVPFVGHSFIFMGYPFSVLVSWLPGLRSTYSRASATVRPSHGSKTHRKNS